MRTCVDEWLRFEYADLQNMRRNQMLKHLLQFT
jgi:hypothetical protein